MKVDFKSVYPKLEKRFADPEDSESAVLSILDADNLAIDTNLSKLQESVVQLKVGVTDEKGNFVQLGNGSAVVVSPDGLVITAKHVISNDYVAEALASNSYTDDVKNQIEDLYKKDGLYFLVEIPSLSDDGVLMLEYLNLKLLEISDDYDIAVGSINLDDRDQSNSALLQSALIKPGLVSFETNVFSLGHPLGVTPNVLSSGKVYNPELLELKNMLNGNHNDLGVLKMIISTPQIPSLIFMGAPFASRDVLAEKFEHLKSKSKLDPDEIIVSSNHVISGNSGGLLCDESGQMLGMPVATSPRSRMGMFWGYDNSTKTHSESSDSIIKFLLKQVPNLDFQKLLSGEEVNAPELLRKASLSKKPIF